MVTTSARVLLVEDDDALRLAVCSALRSEGYTVRGEPHGSRIDEIAAAFSPDIVLLDVRLAQGPDGLTMAELLRRQARQVPIILLTAAGSPHDRLAGFEAGADDYLVKPFIMAELLARMRAVLRRSGALPFDTWQLGDVLVDESQRHVSRAGCDIELTPTEFDLLVTLARNADRVLSKTQLLCRVWGFADYDTNLVEVHISALRRKLDRHGPSIISTVRGAGYRLDTPAGARS